MTAGMTPQTVYEEDLPESVRELIELIGLPATLKLVEKYGGIYAHIPCKVGPNHTLAVDLGLDKAQILVDYYGGTYPYIPRLAEVLRHNRNREIIQKFEDGVSARRLARRYKLSIRQIWYILKQPLSMRMIKDFISDQLELF